jgi:hypothetical protein
MTGKERLLPEFSLGPKGTKDQFWLINGHPDFSIIPAGVLADFPADTPIRLPAGDKKYGAIHIGDKHGHWVKKHQPNGCVATLVHRKLSQPGKIFTTESSDKLSLMMRLAPEAFMVLKVMDGFFSVTTLYLKNRSIDDQELGRYSGEWAVSRQKPVPL